MGAEYSHNGEISCLIHLETRSEISRVSHANLAVLPRTELRSNKFENDMSDSSPSFLQGPCDGTALVSSTVTLDAFYSGKPEPEIKWFRGVSNFLECEKRKIQKFIVQLFFYK